MSSSAGWLFSPAVGDQSGPEHVWVRSKSDLPTAAGGIITLVDDRTYAFTTSIDLTGDRIVAGTNNALIGDNSITCGILSTGLAAGTALITTISSMPMRGIFLTHGTVLDCDAVLDATAEMHWDDVHFKDCTTIGTVKDYSRFVARDVEDLSSGDLTFEGTFGTIAFNDCLFAPPSGDSAFCVDSGATITQHLRVVDCEFEVTSGATGITLTPASFPAEGIILQTCLFEGAGTYLSGFDHNDNEALILTTIGITNSVDIAQYYVIGNATETTISTQDVWVKAAGTTAAGPIVEKFTLLVANRAVYTGALDTFFRVVATGSLTGGNNKQISVGIAKNGTVIASSESPLTSSSAGRADSWTTQAVVELVGTDYIEMWVVNRTDTSNVTVTNLNVIVEHAL